PGRVATRGVVIRLPLGCFAGPDNKLSQPPSTTTLGYYRIMDGMEIRFATEDDLSEMVSVQREVHDIHARKSPNYYRAATDDELLQAMKEVLAGDSTKVWIAF